jgi:hypothetical protein
VSGRRAAEAAAPVPKRTAPDAHHAYGGNIMDTNTLLIIVVVLLLLGGGGFFFRGRG